MGCGTKLATISKTNCNFTKSSNFDAWFPRRQRRLPTQLRPFVIRVGNDRLWWGADFRLRLCLNDLSVGDYQALGLRCLSEPNNASQV